MYSVSLAYSLSAFNLNVFTISNSKQQRISCHLQAGRNLKFKCSRRIIMISQSIIFLFRHFSRGLIQCCRSQNNNYYQKTPSKLRQFSHNTNVVYFIAGRCMMHGLFLPSNRGGWNLQGKRNFICLYLLIYYSKREPQSEKSELVNIIHHE